MAANPNPNGDEQYVDLSRAQTLGNFVRRPEMPSASTTSTSAERRLSDHKVPPVHDRSDSGPFAELSGVPFDLPPLTKAVTKLSEHQEEREQFDASSRLPPVYIFPSKPKGGNSYGWPKQPYWLPERVMSSSWLTLFYDLVMVAVLNTFATTHDTTSASAVGVFWSYFAVIWWLWVSQMVYDIRFSAEDMYHRLFKLFEIFVFMYIGAASAGWSPIDILQNSDAFAIEATNSDEAATSFLCVTVAYAASRFLLAFQYLVLMVVARRAGRPLPSLALSFAGTSLSGVLCVVAAALDVSSVPLAIEKPVLLYTGIFIEVVALGCTPFLRSYIPLPSHALSERIAALTLIILGEGLLGLVATFNRVVNGFSAKDPTTFGEVCCAVVIVYLLWMFYFTGFDARHWMGRRRTWFWAVLHMPLHFTIMLLLGGMINSIKFAAFRNGVRSIEFQFIHAMIDENGNAIPPVGELQTGANRELALRLGKLALLPPWQQELQLLQQGNLTDPNGPEFPTAEIYAYLGQIFLKTAMEYKVEVSNGMQTADDHLWQLNTTLSGNATLDQHVAEMAADYFVELQVEGYNAALEGTLWLLPAAGGVLLLIGLVNCVRYHFRSMRAPYYYIAQICVGVSLCFTGFLSLGSNEIAVPSDPSAELDVNAANKIYPLDFKNWLLPIPTMVYFVLWFVGLVSLLVRRRMRGKHLTQDEARDHAERHPPVEEPETEPVGEKETSPA